MDNLELRRLWSTPAAVLHCIVLDAQAPILAGASADDLIDRWIFSGNRPLVSEVHVAGRRVVAGGRHLNRDAVAARFSRAMAGLMARALPTSRP